MFSILSNRDARSRWRAIVVCAMLPLTVLNGRTVVGCGCNGHFEAVCHCNCSGSTCCNSKHGTTCPCCKKHEKTGKDETKDTSGSDICVHGRHCKGIAQHEVIPATVPSSHAADEIGLAAFTLDLIDVPTTPELSSPQQQIIGHTSPPPLDRVVALHRLVI